MYVLPSNAFCCEIKHIISVLKQIIYLDQFTKITNICIQYVYYYIQYKLRQVHNVESFRQDSYLLKNQYKI